jgi:hypothetical protein
MISRTRRIEEPFSLRVVLIVLVRSKVAIDVQYIVLTGGHKKSRPKAANRLAEHEAMI